LNTAQRLEEKCRVNYF